MGWEYRWDFGQRHDERLMIEAEAENRRYVTETRKMCEIAYNNIFSNP